MRVFSSLLLIIMLSSCFLTSKKSSKIKSDRVVLETNYGNIELVLYDQTPIHKQNFLMLVDSGYYDGMLFHRVIPKFMIQAGDPDSKTATDNKNLGNGGPGYTLEAEIIDSLIHKRGALAAARLGDDVNPEKKSSGSQFYLVQGRVFTSGDLQRVLDNTYQQRKIKAVKIFLSKPENETIFKRIQYCQGARLVREHDSIIKSLEPKLQEQMGGDAKPSFSPSQIQTYTTIGGAPHLDGGYTVFGEITTGFNVLDSICALRTNAFDRPIKNAVILKAKRLRN